MSKSKEDYNKEWIELSQQMQSLEIKRRELYNQHKKEFGSIDLKTENVPSIFYDLNRKDINISKLN
jgi:hypothetical protein|tara:strand:- start:144 stop:341 length:198 start_codon:yes stop_codon:yes gene_type:complete